MNELASDISFLSNNCCLGRSGEGEVEQRASMRKDKGRRNASVESGSARKDKHTADMGKDKGRIHSSDESGSTRKDKYSIRPWITRIRGTGGTERLPDVDSITAKSLNHTSSCPNNKMVVNVRSNSNNDSQTEITEGFLPQKTRSRSLLRAMKNSRNTICNWQSSYEIDAPRTVEQQKPLATDESASESSLQSIEPASSLQCRENSGSPTMWNEIDKILTDCISSDGLETTGLVRSDDASTWATLSMSLLKDDDAQSGLSTSHLYRKKKVRERDEDSTSTASTNNLYTEDVDDYGANLDTFMKLVSTDESNPEKEEVNTTSTRERSAIDMLPAASLSPKYHHDSEAAPALATFLVGLFPELETDKRAQASSKKHLSVFEAFKWSLQGNVDTSERTTYEQNNPQAFLRHNKY